MMANSMAVTGATSSANGRRVFVHGVGAITALGSSWASTRAALLAGQSAIAPVPGLAEGGFDVRGFPSTVAAAIRNFNHTGERRLALVQVAAREAFANTGWFDGTGQGPGATPTWPDATRVGIFLGAESGRAPFSTLHALTRAAGAADAQPGTQTAAQTTAHTGSPFNHHLFGLHARPLAAQFDASIISPAAVSSVLAREYAAHGPVQTLSLACSSSAAALAEAARAIRLGVCDVALAGGVGADVDALMLAGFGKLGALSERGNSCPFDVRRDGFVVGEGAAMVWLSCQPPNQLNRGAVCVELAGEGRSLDAWHLTAPEPQGRGIRLAMHAALRNAGVDAVDYIQAHGTSTPLNDAVEAVALQQVFGSRLGRAHVSSVKGALGHWVAGAGALGFLCAYGALQEGWMPPTANLNQPDPACELPHILHHAMRKDCELALVNAFAFGGANCSLVLRRTA